MNNFSSFFSPRSIAVIGASERVGSVGKAVMGNLVSSCYLGHIFPVHPTRKTVMNCPCYPSILEITDDVDLAIIIIPAVQVPQAVQQCGEKGVPSIIIISAGFKELGEPGLKLERQVLDIARNYSIRIVGPNCLGMMNPYTDLNATFSSAMAKRGNVGFISQSGALCTAVLDWSFAKNIGFSAFVSLGSMLDVDWGDCIQYLADDPNTKSIFIYMETIGNAASFLQAAKRIAGKKPIVVIKGGKTREAAQAAVSHTGSLAGNDEAISAAFEQSGVLRVESIDLFFDLIEFLSSQPLPKGPSLTIITNAGGPGVLATDALIKSGGKLSPLSQDTLSLLQGHLPPNWSHSNPIDILGDADASRYKQALQAISNDSTSDGTLVILTPQEVTEPHKTAQVVVAAQSQCSKPLFASWIGGKAISAGRALLRENHIPTFSFPDRACHSFSLLWEYQQYCQHARDPVPELTLSLEEREEMQSILDRAKGERRSLLTEVESKRFFSLGHIPCLTTVLAESKEEAVAKAREIGFPVVLKLVSHVITHKSDWGGVKLNITSCDEIERAYEEMQEAVESRKKGGFQGVSVQPMVKEEGYEVILGSIRDDQLGPLLLFGTGGKLVEIYRDSVMFLPPLSPFFAQRMIKKTKIGRAFAGVRGNRPIDEQKLISVLTAFSHLLVAFPEIKESDLNPFFLSHQTLVAIDARIVL